MVAPRRFKQLEVVSRLKVPLAATPAQTEEGEVVWDNDSDLLTVGTGSTRKTMVDTNSTQTLTNKTLTDPTVTRTSQKYVFKAGAKVGATAGWAPAATDNVHLITLPASQTGSTLVVPISGLKVGWTITSYHLIGQIESAGGTVTVDADLRKQTAAAADVTDASIGAITQLSVTADTIMSASNTAKTLSTPEVIGADETFYLLITGTTAASTDIALQGVAVVVDEA